MKMKWLFASLFLLAGCAMSWAQAGKSAEHRTVTEILDGPLTNIESEFVPAAEAMPEDKYSFAPTGGEFKGVRTFAQQIKHVAAVNYLLGGGILQEKPPADTGEENGPASVTSKADIVKYLKDSFAYLHKAVKSIDENNEAAAVKSPFGDGQATRLGLAIGAISHPNDHYGQMVVYLRMNGIVPPASR
jgi:DinB superfamily